MLNQTYDMSIYLKRLLNLAVSLILFLFERWSWCYSKLQSISPNSILISLTNGANYSMPMILTSDWSHTIEKITYHTISRHTMQRVTAWTCLKNSTPTFCFLFCFVLSCSFFVCLFIRAQQDPTDTFQCSKRDNYLSRSLLNPLHKNSVYEISRCLSSHIHCSVSFLADILTLLLHLWSPNSSNWLQFSLNVSFISYAISEHFILTTIFKSYKITLES